MGHMPVEVSALNIESCMALIDSCLYDVMLSHLGPLELGQFLFMPLFTHIQTL